MLHHEKLIKTMHNNSWEEHEIKKSLTLLEKIKSLESKETALVRYWLNLFYIFTIIFVTAMSLTPIFSLNNKALILVLIAIIGFIFGLLTMHSILVLEEYNEKHHRIWSNMLLFILLFFLTYFVIDLMLKRVGIQESAFKHAIIYKLSFAIPTSYSIIKHELEVKNNKNLKKHITNLRKNKNKNKKIKVR